MKVAILFITVVLLTQCGRHSENSDPSAKSTTSFNESDIVVHSQAMMDISVSGGQASIASITNSNPVSVVNAASSTMAVDSSKFKAPTITSSLLNFGTLSITALSDNDLNVCGAAKNTKCGNALLRMYTTGVAGAGLYNAIGAYGAPMTSTLTTPLTVGLNVAGAAVMQTLVIPAGKNVVALADFATKPLYTINFNFSNAGAGNYSTTVVLEYALAP